MDFLETVKQRRSVRRYTSQVPDETLVNTILECARLAPSAVNLQPCHYHVVRSEDMRRKVQQSYDREWFATAPLYIVVCVDSDVAWTRREDGRSHAAVDAAIAAEHICLAATALGLGTCWVCNFKPAVLSDALHLPPHVEPIAIIPVGYADADATRPQQRKPIGEMVTVW